MITKLPKFIGLEEIQALANLQSRKQNRLFTANTITRTTDSAVMRLEKARRTLDSYESLVVEQQNKDSFTKLRVANPVQSSEKKAG